MGRPLALVTNPIHDAGYAKLAQDCEVVRFDRLADKDEQEAALARADLLIIRSFPLSADVIARCKRLRSVGKHGAGVDNVDIAALTQAGVPLANTPGASNATAVSEGALMLMLAVLRKTIAMDRIVREHEFDKRFAYRGGDLWEHTVGIVGLGNIGTHVARICGKGFNMRVLAYDPYLSDEAIAARGALKVDMATLLRESDVVTIHTPLTKETQHFIGRDQFALMKPGAILINTSRGPTVDPQALYEALASKQIAGAGIDVFDPEPPKAGSPLLELDNVVLSPHTAGLTEESTRQMALRTVEVAMKMLAGEKVPTLLNPAVWDRRRQAEALAH